MKTSSPALASTSASLALTRRQLLRAAAASGLALAFPPLRLLSQAGTGAPAPALATFLTAPEYAIVEAATARLFPTDSTPGAREAGVAVYIQGLLSQLPSADASCDGHRGAADFIALVQATAAGGGACADADVNRDGSFGEADVKTAALSLFEGRPVFAGGPFSGRQPFVDAEAHAPSNQFPSNAFLNFIPLTRVQRLALKARLDGTGAIPELQGNPLAMGSAVNLRQQYRDGLEQLETISLTQYSSSFVDLTTSEQDVVLNGSAVSSFVSVLMEHTIEGLFCAPEYGGNRDRIGWQLIGYDGDSQPLGHTLGFDEDLGEYVDRPDQPNSSPSPGEDCSGFSTEMEQFLRILLATQMLQEYPDPECLGVDA